MKFISTGTLQSVSELVMVRDGLWCPLYAFGCL